MNKTQISITVAGTAYVNHDLDELIAKLGREQVEAAIAAETLKEARSARSEAYRRESDPLYLEWKYDQTPDAEQIWRDKVAEIKVRFPLPSA
ncbi:MAG: hypothetical protein ACRCXB_22735 [Aeromonadaceae bacterium]